MRLTMTRKLFLCALAVAFTLLVSHYVLAAPNPNPTPEPEPVGEFKVYRVEMGMDTMTVRVNQERSLWVSITLYNKETRKFRFTTDANDEWPISWSSSNPEVATVDDGGRLTGISPGTTIVTAQADNGMQTTCKVTVPSSVLTGIELETTNSETATYNSGERIEATRVRADVEEAAKNTPAGQTATVSYSERTVISTTALRSAAFSAEVQGRPVTLRFRTLDADGVIQGQLSLNPGGAPSEDYDVLVGVRTDTATGFSAASGAKTRLGVSQAAGIRLAHSGDFGFSVEVAARVSLTGGTPRIYRYESGTYTLVEGAGAWIDTNGYIHFTVTRGGTYVATV